MHPSMLTSINPFISQKGSTFWNIKHLILYEVNSITSPLPLWWNGSGNPTLRKRKFLVILGLLISYALHNWSHCSRLLLLWNYDEHISIWIQSGPQTLKPTNTLMHTHVMLSSAVWHRGVINRCVSVLVFVCVQKQQPEHTTSCPLIIGNS